VDGSIFGTYLDSLRVAFALFFSLGFDLFDELVDERFAIWEALKGGV